MRHGAVRRLHGTHRRCRLRACLTPIDSIGGSDITTIEAIGATAPGVAIQKAWLDVEVMQYAVQAQIQSEVLFGVIAGLYGEITLKNGRVEHTNFGT